MKRTPITRLLVLAAATLVTVGCGGTDSSVVRPPQTSAAATASSPGTPTSSPVARHPKTRVKPATGLRDGQTVTVTASGFSPGLTLVVIECADKGKATGQGDCNLAVSTMVHTDAAGRVTTQLKVSRGPFGANNVVCGATLHCLVSVTEAALTPSEEADAPISFG